MSLVRAVLALLLLMAAGCGGWPLLQQTAAPRETVVTPVLSTPTPATPVAAPQPVTLRVWLPPQFDPHAAGAAAALLQARLEQFAARQRGVKIEVRVKALEGPGGLLDSLSAASAAAPLALPDLVALPRPLLEAAALKGLLYPYDTLSSSLDELDWYDYARQLGRLQNSTFGLPFAGDALVLVYRPAAIAEAPRDWAAALTITQTLAFPAADEQALFTLALYQSAGGATVDEQGRPLLDAIVLTQVLTFYQKAEQSGLIPYWLTQYTSNDQVWELYQQGKVNLTAAWASRYLGQAAQLPDSAATLLPTADGVPYSLATGWAWALAAPDAERRALATQLAEFLTDSQFLANWTATAGYLPPRSSALAAWPESSLRSLTSQWVLSARLYPTSDVLASLGTPLKQATIQVLKQQSEPLDAAQEAADYLAAP